MRLFTAIDIPGEIKERLRAFLEPLRPLAKISWSSIANLHITTKFIGEWPDARLNEVKTALASVQHRGAIGIHVRGVGWFPNARHPRVLWAGVIVDAMLANLASATEGVVTPLGVHREDRDYNPHLTLARIRDAVPLDHLRNALNDQSHDFGAFRASAFFLYLSRAGEYTKLAEYSLE